MSRTVQVRCPSCGHQQTVLVDSSAKDETAAQAMDADDTPTSAAERQRRLESLPTSLPVGGIITPV